jgi:hypothetical protein
MQGLARTLIQFVGFGMVLVKEFFFGLKALCEFVAIEGWGHGFLCWKVERFERLNFPTFKPFNEIAISRAFP